MRIFEKQKFHNHLLKSDDFRLFSSMENTEFPDKNSDYAKNLFKYADDLLDEDIPFIPVSLYMQFEGIGNRTNYENLYFKRRIGLTALFLAEIIQKENRYIEKIIDYVWAIMEETSWVLPASNLNRSGDIDSDKRVNMPYTFECEPWYIDLFTSETCALLSLVNYYLKDEFIKKDASIMIDRLNYELKRRIYTPFLKYNDLWWMGFGNHFTNNWNPWIVYNILVSAAVSDISIKVKQKIVKKAAACLDNFISGYPEDGGCNEGPSYWFEAGGHLFDILELLDEMTDSGSDELFKNPLINNMTSYMQKVHISDSYFITYGDSHAKLKCDGKLLRRIGRRFNNPVMSGFGQDIINKTSDSALVDIPRINVLRYIRNLFDTKDSHISYAPELVSALPDTEICIFRQVRDSKKGFTAWLKGGHNAESHNHNDLGSIGLYDDGEPVLIDIGIGTYVKDTFSNKRYTLFPIRSIDHNIPQINGKGQKYGAEFRTDFFRIDSDNRIAKVGLKNAYENKDEIKDYTRTVSLSDDYLSITDEIELKTDGDVVSNFYSYLKPELMDNRKIKLGDRIIMRYSSDVTPEFEQINFTDEAFIRDWNTESIYKLSFATDKAKSFNTQYTFTKNR